MAYQSLYRRYRPQRFADVHGQEHLVRALRNAVTEDRVGHAYLLSGPRGTGKTTTARILAKALNCPDVADGEPCGVCESCVAIQNGRSFDLQELDAASNRGIGEMKALLETIALGTPGRRKVYILDEVHMLTKEASAALLKSLEEPPGHVVFVLATTDPQKVLPTIRSRTQHFELQLLAADELRALIDEIAADAGLELSAEQIEYALHKGAGSARDTLSVLDQVAAAGSAPATAEALGVLLDGLVEGDAGAALAAVQQAMTAGREPRVIGEQLLDELRDGFLAAVKVDLANRSPDAQARAAEVAARWGARALTRALELVGEALVEMRQAADPRIPLEVAVLRIARPEADRTVDALAQRVERLERALAEGGFASAPAPGGGPTGGPNPAPSDDPVPASLAASPTDTAAPPGSDSGPGSDGGPDEGSPSGAAARPSKGSRVSTTASSRPADSARQALAAAPAAPVDPEPEAPAAPTGGSRPALGAHRSGARSRARTAAPDQSVASVVPEPVAPDSPAAREKPTKAADTATAVDSRTRPGDDAASSGTSDAPLPSRDELTLAWGDVVRGQLAQRTKSRWNGRFVGVTDRAEFGLPNQITCDRCEEGRAEVEAALAAHFGRPVPVRLVVDDASTPPDDALDPARVHGARGSDEPDAGEIDEVGPVDELADAGDPVDGAARLADAFPGAELVEVDGDR